MADDSKTGTRAEGKPDTARPYTVLQLTEDPELAAKVAADPNTRVWLEHDPVHTTNKRTAIKRVLGDQEGTAEAVANFKPVTRKIETKKIDRWSDGEEN